MGNIVTGNDNKETEINCEIHSIPYSGVCGDKNCYEGGLICLKCEPEACTTTKLSHELISINEFYIRFFTKNSGSVDFKKLIDLVDNLKKVDQESLLKKIDNYKKYAISLIDDKLKEFDENIVTKLEGLKKNLNLRLQLVQKEYLEAESRVDFSTFEIPENFSLEETKKFFEKNSKSVKDMENMINLVKKYSDNEKLSTNQKDMETIIYSKNIIDHSTQDLIDEKLELIIQDIQQGLQELLTILTFEKESSNIFFHGVKKFNSNPCKLWCNKDITLQSQKSYTIDSVFAAFNTVDGNSYVAWANPTHGVDVFDLKTNAIVKTLVGHTQLVYIVRHFFHNKETTDYLLSSSYERCIKVWNANTFTLTVSIPNCHTGYYLYSALIVFDEVNLKAYALSTAPNEVTKVWDIPTGKHVKDITTTTDYTYYLNTWYDTRNNGIYIINANSIDVKIYDFRTNIVYKIFKPDVSTWHMSAMVHELKEIPHLFETDGNGFLRIWNIQTGTLFKSIQAAGCSLRGICLWNDQYIITASSDKSFKIFDITTFTLVTSISGHDNVLCTVEKVLHPVYGEVLLTAAIDGKIKLWIDSTR